MGEDHTMSMIAKFGSDHMSISIDYENMPIQIYWKFYNPKMKNFREKILIFFIILLKTYIVGTH